MRNMTSILKSHNKKIVAENEKQYQCNCRNRDECPLENKYLTPQIMYETHVITLNTSRNFSVALSDTPFQEHYSNHKRDFTNRHYVKSIELSKYIWNLQESGKEFTIHWENLSHIKGMTKRGYCSLC